jgi:hypothetical protein
MDCRVLTFELNCILQQWMSVEGHPPERATQCMALAKAHHGEMQRVRVAGHSAYTYSEQYPQASSRILLSEPVAATKQLIG